MSYIFNFRYKPSTNLSELNEFIRLKKLKWKSRNVSISGDIQVKFISSSFDSGELSGIFNKIKNSGVSIDSIECDNGSFITCENLIKSK